MAELIRGLVPQSAGIPTDSLWYRSFARGRACAINVGRCTNISARLYRASAQEQAATRNGCAFRSLLQCPDSVLQRHHVDTLINTGSCYRAPGVGRPKPPRDNNFAALFDVDHDLASGILARNELASLQSEPIKPNKHTSADERCEILQDLSDLLRGQAFTLAASGSAARKRRDAAK